MDEEEEARDRPPAGLVRTAVPVRPEEGGGAVAAAAGDVETTSSLYLISRHQCLQFFFLTLTFRNATMPRDKSLKVVLTQNIAQDEIMIENLKLR